MPLLHCLQDKDRLDIANAINPNKTFQHDFIKVVDVPCYDVQDVVHVARDGKAGDDAVHRAAFGLKTVNGGIVILPAMINILLGSFILFLLVKGIFI